MAIELATAYVSLVPSMTGVQGKIARDLVPAAGRAGDTAGQEAGKKMGSRLGGALKAGLAGAAVGLGGRALLDFANNAVSSFAELEDTTAAAGVVFGDSMGAIIEQSRTASRELGLSQSQVIDASNTFGTYGKSAGLAGDDLSGFSTEMTALAADMASFKGTSPEDAILAVGAALRGENEPIRRYGVLLDDASLRQKALEMGIVETTKNALTPQQKVLAAQQLILEQTSDAQGDFQRTSASTANTQKILAAEAENLRAKLGQQLAPAFTAVRRVANNVLGGFSSAIDVVVPKVEAFVGWVKENERWLSALARVVGSFLAVWAAYRTVVAVVTTVQAAYNAVLLFGRGIQQAYAMGTYGQIAGNGGLIASTAALTGALRMKLAALTANIGATLRAVAVNVQWQVLLLRQSAAHIAHRAAMIASTAATNLAALAQKGLNLALKANPIGIVITLIAALVGAVVWLYNNNETARKVIDGAWSGIKSAISAVGDWITGTAMPAVRSAVEAVQTTFERVSDGIGEAWSRIQRAAAVPVNFVIDTVYNNGIRKLWNGIADALGLDATLPKVATVNWGAASGYTPSSSRRGLAMAEGGVLPGPATPGRDVHRFFSPTGGYLELSGGEGFIRPDALARLGGKAWLDRVNRSRGGSGPGFAEGGIWDRIRSIGSVAAQVLSDPAGGIRSLILEPVQSLFSQITSSPFGQLLVELPRKAIEGLIEKAKSWLSGVFGGGDDGAPPAAGAWGRPSRGSITSGYGPRWGAFHAGVDFAGGGRTYAAAAGRVAQIGFAGVPGRTGRHIVVDHGGGVWTYYGHNPLGALPVGVGDRVGLGQHLGYEGTTGNVTGKHLHFELWRGGWGRHVNPRSLGVFDTGGWVPTGRSVIENRTGKPELLANVTPGASPGLGNGDVLVLQLEDGSTLRGFVRRQARGVIDAEIRDLSNRGGGW